VPDKSLPDQPNLEQYKKQAKDLLRAHGKVEPAALDRIARHHPRLHNQSLDAIRLASFRLSDSQLVIAPRAWFRKLAEVRQAHRDPPAEPRSQLAQ
jgi:hypothetical protein